MDSCWWLLQVVVVPLLWAAWTHYTTPDKFEFQYSKEFHKSESSSDDGEFLYALTVDAGNPFSDVIAVNSIVDSWAEEFPEQFERTASYFGAPLGSFKAMGMYETLESKADVLVTRQCFYMVFPCHESAQSGVEVFNRESSAKMQYFYIDASAPVFIAKFPYRFANTNHAQFVAWNAPTSCVSERK